MRLSSLAVLAGASLGLALPIKEADLQASTASPNDYKDVTAPHHVAITWSADTEGATLQDYMERIKEEMPFIRSNEKEFNLVATIPTESTPISDAEPVRSSYGVAVAKLLPQEQPHENNNGLLSQIIHIIHRVKQIDILEIVDRNGPECVAIAIFVLAPLIFFTLELLEMLVKYCIKERFPRRGRDPIRLSGPERQLRALSDMQREKMVERGRPWWKARLARI